MTNHSLLDYSSVSDLCNATKGFVPLLRDHADMTL